MTTEEYKMHVDLARTRYHYLNLTFEQAEKVYKYEQEKDIYSEKHFFSFWEERDYELTAFRDILNPEQLETHQTFTNESIRYTEQSLIEQDSKRTNEIAYYEELINFYQTHVLPDLFKSPFIHVNWFLNDKPKVEYLKSEYKHFLNETKKGILTSHFRHNRTFKPNELKLSLLRYKLLCLVPDYSYFKHQMDEPTKAVAQYLSTKYRHLPEEAEQLFKAKLKDIREFNELKNKEYYGERKAWFVINELTEEEAKEYHSMTFLLLHRDRHES